MWSPWHGCHKCSEGCANCYVFYLDQKRDKDAGVVTKSKTGFNLPIKKGRDGRYKIESGSELATCFTSDFFLKEADEWREDAWAMIKARPDVDFLICTKRIERFNECLPYDWGDGYDNVAIAVTCECQRTTDIRMPIFLSVKAKHKLIFAAPLLEKIDIEKYLDPKQIECLSVGGESYDYARECNFDWVKDLYNQCKRKGVKFDFHQTGSNFVMNGKRYKIRHRVEHEQAKKGLKYLHETD